MKIYEYSYSLIDSGIKCREVEVEEKEKIYIAKRGSTCWRTQIKKANIGRLDDTYFFNMYLLEKDVKTYVNALKDYWQKEAEVARSKYEYAMKKAEEFKEFLKKAEAADNGR